MPRNGSGVYSLPDTYEAVSGETIEAQQHNDPLEDLESDANAARPIVAGGTGATTAQGILDNIFTAARTIKDDKLTIVDPDDTTKKVRLDAGNVTAGQTRVLTMADRNIDLGQMDGKGSDVASAATLTLGAGVFFHVTGNTTITDIDFTNGYDGRWAILEFDGALTLTHHATTLVLPGRQNITTAAGDTCMVVQDASDNVHVVWYTRAAPIPYTAGSFTPLYRAGGDSTGVTYSTQSGSYIRVGRAVFFSLRVTLSNAGSATGAVSIANLPFTAGTINYPVSVGHVLAAVNLTGALTAYVGSGSTSISIVQWGATGTSGITQANIGNTFDIIISGYYEAVA